VNERPQRRHWSYTYTADGRILISAKDLMWITSVESRIERDIYEAALDTWYKDRGVSREPYLAGESLDVYNKRTLCANSKWDCTRAATYECENAPPTCDKCKSSWCTKRKP
jgi:hypothetical protein